MFEKGNLSTFEKGLFPIIGKYSLENSIVGKVVSFSLIAVSFYGFSNLYSWIGGYCINIIYKVIRTAAQLHITTEVPTIIIEGTHISLECQSICLSFGCQPSLNNFPY